MEPVTRYPTRSPLIIGKTIQPLIEGKTVCDLGCGIGDMMFCFLDNGANGVIGIEKDHELAKNAANRGLDVIVGNVMNVDLPKTDIYYNWLNTPYNYEVLDRLWDTIIVTGSYKMWPGIDEKIGGIELFVPLDFEGKPGEWFKIHIIDKRGKLQNN